MNPIVQYGKYWFVFALGVGASPILGALHLTGFWPGMVYGLIVSVVLFNWFIYLDCR